MKWQTKLRKNWCFFLRDRSGSNGRSKKYYENGEYLRSAEMAEEQNYNMIDGRLNNISGKISGKKQAKQKERTSVLEKLHRKQKEIAIRSGKQPEQAMGADMERNRNLRGIVIQLTGYDCKIPIIKSIFSGFLLMCQVR